MNISHNDTTLLQVETTSRCTLRCPACSRTVFSSKLNRPTPIHDLDPHALYRFLDCDSGKKIDQLLLCGDYGDSIYYPRLFEFIDLFRSSKTFRIVTNGSYQKEDFWRELCARLTPNDIIEFSIDGWDQKSNEQYRVNSNWESIMMGVDIVANSDVQLNWATNIFSFNHNNLDKIKRIADAKGANFLCKTTSRFGNEALRPPAKFVDHQAEYQDSYHTNKIEIEPKCTSITRNTVSSQHYFMPCGWICAPMVIYKSRLWPNKQNWSIDHQTLDQLQSTTLAEWVKDIRDNPDAADTICKMRCKAGQPPKIYHEL